MWAQGRYRRLKCQFSLLEECRTPQTGKDSRPRRMFRRVFIISRTMLTSAVLLKAIESGLTLRVLFILPFFGKQSGNNEEHHSHHSFGSHNGIRIQHTCKGFECTCRNAIRFKHMGINLQNKDSVRSLLEHMQRDPEGIVHFGRDGVVRSLDSSRSNVIDYVRLSTRQIAAYEGFAASDKQWLAEAGIDGRRISDELAERVPSINAGRNFITSANEKVALESRSGAAICSPIACSSTQQCLAYDNCNVCVNPLTPGSTTYCAHL